MSQSIIEVNGISKRYQLGAIGATRLRDDLERLWHRATGQAEEADKDEFWALRDVSFDIRPGEIVGIIGRNGAGKSTLLKILSRITEPTDGEIVLRGRVASLLEVGTGFVGDLSGRDNVFLNGAILGMTKAEIRSKFDEIVAFAEIEKFIDTPVKRYSSGMYVRLAFAVAAHLEPEILIIDEVLAVGDVKFQEKCLGKMETAGKSGRTILFVSHHLASVQRLCKKGVFLSSGQVSAVGGIGPVLEKYMLEQGVTVSGVRMPNYSAPLPYILDWSLEDVTSESTHSCFSRESPLFRINVFCPKLNHEVQLGFIIRAMTGEILISANSCDNRGKMLILAQGKNVVYARVRVALKTGSYRLDLALATTDFRILDQWTAEPLLTILPSEDTVLQSEWQGLINEPVVFS